MVRDGIASPGRHRGGNTGLTRLSGALARPSEQVLHRRQSANSSGGLAGTGTCVRKARGSSMMRVTLQVVSGPHAGKRITLSRGQSATFGRTPEADYQFAEDPLMSSRHFALEVD